MDTHIVARVADFPPGTRRIVTAGGRSIGVFNVRGAFFALRNSCPHQAAPLCRGLILGRVSADRPYALTYDHEHEIIKCPWHGWEFDLRTGRSVFNPHRVRVRAYDVTIEPVTPTVEQDPSVETYAVTVEDGLVVLHA
jgi:3-phenylpropionate/trans-cinnamate dioxygenase ferredoxin subunit